MAFTYNDPVIFAEYAMDIADACHDQGVKTVAVTAGYIHAEPRREFYAKMDAANVDLKGFTDDFYYKICGGRLQPVLDTLVYLAKETDVWTEITTLLIPGKNDSDEELKAQCKWMRANLGPDVPLHFTAFHPDWKMTDVRAHAGLDADAGATNCTAGRPELRLHRQRARRNRRFYLLPVVRAGSDPTRLVRYPRLSARRRGRLQELRHPHPGPVPEIRQAVRAAPHPGEARAAGLTTRTGG